MCSDYCFDDKNKPNNVVSFVIYPYIFDFDEWNNAIDFMQKSDLKHCRKVSSAFCNFVKAGYIFCFNFILEKNCILDKWKDKASMDKAIQDLINTTELWQHTTPKNVERYKVMNLPLLVLYAVAAAHFYPVAVHVPYKSFFSVVFIPLFDPAVPVSSCQVPSHVIAVQRLDVPHTVLFFLTDAIG